MKRSKLRKQSKQPISKIQRRLWQLCKLIVRAKYGNTCYTCGRSALTGSNWQTGHMWAKASVGAYLKYDLRILRPQCAICNLFQGGRGADFYRKMLSEIGKSAMNALERDRRVIVKAYDHYSKLLIEYQAILNELSPSNP